MPDGQKFDQGKLRTDLLSVDALLGTAKVLTHGATKYGDRNWEEGILFHRVYGAVLRHLLAWWNQEDIDKDSGLPHIDLAACELMFLQHFVHDYEMYGRFDDRPQYIVPAEVTTTTEHWHFKSEP